MILENYEKQIEAVNDIFTSYYNDLWLAKTDCTELAAEFEATAKINFWFNCLLVALCRFRNDFIVSDREASAFLLTWKTLKKDK